MNPATPKSALTGECWWIVETLELGKTAMPGRVLAYQGAEVCRGLRMKVTAVRPALPLDIGDALAIRESKQELRDAQARIAVAAGALGNQHGSQKKIAAAP
jgi:hypothetical protein